VPIQFSRISVVNRRYFIDLGFGSKVKDGYARKFLKGMHENCWSAVADDFRTFLLSGAALARFLRDPAGAMGTITKDPELKFQRAPNSFNSIR
jgi:hypothetical protein